MSRACQISKKHYNAANSISFSNKKNKHRQYANVQSKRLWLPEENRFVRLKVSTKVLKTINKKGLKATIKAYGANQKKLLG